MIHRPWLLVVCATLVSSNRRECDGSHMGTPFLFKPPLSRAASVDDGDLRHCTFIAVFEIDRVFVYPVCKMHPGHSPREEWVHRSVLQLCKHGIADLKVLSGGVRRLIESCQCE